MDPGAVLLGLLGSANLVEPRVVFEQYDSTVGADTVVGPGHGAAVLRVKGTTKALVASTDGNQAVGVLDPYLGAALSVAEATRNVSITGARPLGVTNCLNYGDPTRPEAFWQLSEGVRGLGDACRALGLPVTGGNVSLYNEAPTGAIAPTPEIGVVGLLDDVATLVGPAFVAGARRRSCSSARRRPGWPARRTRRSPGLPSRTDRRRSTWRARRPSRRSSATPSPAGSSRRRRTCPAAGWPSRWPSARSGAVSVPTSGSASPTRPRSSCSARARRGSSSPTRPRHAPALTLLARQHGLPVEEIGVVGGDRLVIELIGAGATGAAEERGSRVADALEVPSPTCATPGSTACRAPSAGRAEPDVRRVRRGAPDAGPTEAASIATLGLFALQHRGQEIGRRRGERRRAADALQGPRDDQHRPRRAPPAEPPRRSRHRPLPLLDDRLDDLGERPADVPAGAAPGDRDRPQRQPRQHAGAARPAAAAAGRACRRRPTRSS